MKLLVQRVKEASVVVENKKVGKINKGFLVLLRSYAFRYWKGSRIFSKKTMQFENFWRWESKNEFVNKRY